VKIVIKITAAAVFAWALVAGLQYISSDENSIDLVNRSQHDWGIVTDNPMLSLR
jgi:hypothetical protein